MFTSPPFFEMEHYSELEGGLSTMAPEGFQQAYAAILAAAAVHLADHRLMVIITGDVRGEDGNLFEECRELNRMWLSDKAQRNSESRAISPSCV